MRIGRLRLSPRLVDWAIAIARAIAFTVAAFVASDRRAPEWIVALAGLAITLPLAARRRFPLAVELVAAVISVVMAAWVIDGYTTISPLIPLLIGAYSTAVHARGRVAVTGLVVAVVTPGLIALVMGSTVWGDYVFPNLILGFAWLAGWLVRSRTELAARLHEEAVRAEDERELLAEIAVADERRRIARELHDIVAHSMSVMVVQAGGARRILDRDPARAAEAAAQIERTGREALSEMRRLLGVLGVDAERTPQPGMDQVGELVGRARAAGLPVELEVEGDRRRLPAGVDLTGYRIVQEALTNTMKHAASAPTSVRVRYGSDALELQIADRGTVAPRLDDPGHGLIGMRERVRVVGGELHAGPRVGGGFDVRARLPLFREEAA
jgi:signal transduction histidine kinase